MMFFFLFRQPNRGPSADRRETLPHDRNLVKSPDKSNNLGVSPLKILGPKTCKISVNFVPLQTLIANISRARQHIQNRKTIRTRAIPPAFNKKSPVNFGPLQRIPCEFGPTKMHFFRYYISALRGAAP